MNWLDIVILIPTAWYAYKGLKNGLICELASIIALILGVWATVHYSDVLAARMGEGQTYKIIAFAGIFIATLVLVHFAGKLMEKVVKLMIPGFWNNLAGLLFGVAKVVIVFSVLLMFIEKVDTKQVILKPKFKTESFTYKYVKPVAPFLTDWITEKREQNSGVSDQVTGDSGRESQETAFASKRQYLNNPIRQYGVDEQSLLSSSLEEATLSINTV